MPKDNIRKAETFDISHAGATKECGTPFLGKKHTGSGLIQSSDQLSLNFYGAPLIVRVLSLYYAVRICTEYIQWLTIDI